jgi:hypothetical protein
VLGQHVGAAAWRPAAARPTRTASPAGRRTTALGGVGLRDGERRPAEPGGQPAASSFTAYVGMGVPVRAGQALPGGRG